MLKMMIEVKNNIKKVNRRENFGTVALGGTFDHLHKGHQNLLRTAFKISNHIVIGLTTDSLLIHKKHYKLIQSYEEREVSLKRFINKEYYLSEKIFSIIPLKDLFGPAISEPKIDVLVCSNETYRGCLKINQIRINNGLKPVMIMIIPLTLNSSGKKLSSTDIRAEIHQEC